MSSLSRLIKPVLIPAVFGLLLGCAHDPEPFAQEQSLAAQEEERRAQMNYMQRQRDAEAAHYHASRPEDGEAQDAEEPPSEAEAGDEQAAKQATDRAAGMTQRERLGELPTGGMPSLNRPPIGGTPGLLR